MDFPERRRGPFNRSCDIADEDLEFGDLLDLSEPFSWQMPQASPPMFQNRHNQTGSNSRRDVRRGFPDDRFPLHLVRPFPGAGPWRSEAIDEVMDNPLMSRDPRHQAATPSERNAAPHQPIRSGNSVFHSFTQSEDFAHKADQVPPGGYMQRDSPFSLDHTIKEEAMDTSTPVLPANTKVTISYIADDGEIVTLSGVDCGSIEERCPLLALVVEHSKSGPKLHLEALTSATADPFLRYLSTGSYALNSSDLDIFACVPTSLLLHCQLFRLGVIYDLAELRSQANVNIIRQCEFGCSSPDKPIELCSAISYAYEHLSEQSAVLDTIVSYCVSCFLLHRLEGDPGFRQLAYDLRPFHQDLCYNSMKRGFENETAAAIIRMPFKLHKPETYASREDINGKAYADVVHHFHGTDDAEALNKKRKRAAEIVLPLRPALENPFEGGEEVKERATPAFILKFFEAGKASANRKRRSSSITQASIKSEVSAESEVTIKSETSIKSEPSIKSEFDSEPEYELVSGPPSVEELPSDLESDADSAEAVAVSQARPSTVQQTSLPIRARPSIDLSSITTSDHSAHDSASDSEWSMV